ncbi:hypothetical protein SLEP1_g9708 [Rubroshorea leprosula]|uniref:Uncharacterized protein n=1 Tax=Rubroshorea leprosula TaxID=152421 RepID=A0AAV5IBQ7_9ROSI|nr:hypothetical protein SLEP1_g9708 [Rubroshorea leprosula]
MGCLSRCRSVNHSLFYFRMILLTIAVLLMRSSQSRAFPPSTMEVSGSQTDQNPINLESMFRRLMAVLSKGQSVPLFGPSPDIN